VYPYGSYNTSVEQISQAAGYIGGRSVVPGFNGRNSDKYALLSQSVDADTTLAQIEGWIDQAKANKQWLILTFHGVESVTTGDPYATTPAILQSTVNYLSASSIPVLTMGQGMALMGAPKINVNFTVSNTHGGTATPSNFTATVTGANASPATFQGAATTTVVSIDANTQYSVALQSVPTNYIYATSTSCAGSLQIGTTVTCTISMSDISVNHAPVATNGTAATTANTPTTITLAATDSDANPLTYSIVSAPTHGTLTGTTTSRTYTPTTGFTGTDSFTFVANDGQVNSNIATVTVAVSQPVASTTNLILNPSFVLTSAGLPSNWSQGGWGTNTKTFTYPVTGKTDATAAKVQITAYTSGDEKWVFDKVTVTPAHTYTYTDSYQATIASSLEVEYTSTTGVVSYASVTAVPASAATWGTATLTFTVPAGIASARVFHYITGVGSLTIDDASMTDNAGGSNPVPTVTITPATVPAGTVSQAYSQTLTANTTATGTFSWSVSAGSLPAGITLGASTGKTVSVSGTPTAAGTSNFSVRVTNGTSSTTQSYSLVVNAAGSTTPATNLIPNPSFTNGSANAPTSWSLDFWGTNTRTFTYPVTGKTDATAAKVQITAYTDGDAKWVYNPVTVTAGHTYTYTDSYQSTIGSTLEVEYTSSTGVQTYASETVVPASASAWGTATVTFTVPAGTASARVFHYIAAVGSLTIDDASMTDNAGGSTPPPSNLVLNPSFATANSTDATLPQSWTHGGWGTNTTTFTYPTTGKTDSTAVKVQITAFTSGDAKWVMNSAAVTAGSSYTYADSYQSTVASQLVVEYTSTTNTVSYAGFTSVPVNAAWSTSSITFTAPANTASVRVFHLIAGVGSLTIDDVSLVKN
jgi:hypothetical protein